MRERQSITLNWPWPFQPALGTPVTIGDTVVGAVTSVVILDEGTAEQSTEVEVTLKPGHELHEVFL